MNRKQLIFLFFALALIGGAGWVLLSQKKESWSTPEAKMGSKVFARFEPNAVAAIHIQGVTELNLVRKDDVWRVQERYDYPANFHQISDLLLKLKNLKVVQAETVTAAQLARVQLAAPGSGPDGGTLIEFKDAQGKTIESLLAGKRHIHESASPTPGANATDGRYILLPLDPYDVLLIPEALGNVKPDPEAWLNPDFFKIENAKSISLISTNAAHSWKIERTTNDASAVWSLADAKPGETVDASKISMMLNALTFPRFVDIVSNVPLAEIGLDHPTILLIETFDHFVYQLKVGGKSPDDKYPMTITVTAESGGMPEEKPEDPAKTKKLQEKFPREQALQSWIYVVNGWVLEPLLPDRRQLFASTPTAAVAPAVLPTPSPATVNESASSLLIQPQAPGK